MVYLVLLFYKLEEEVWRYASQLKKLKELEEENRRLKRMYADISLDHALLKEVLEKKF